MFGLECSTVCSRDVDVDADRQKRLDPLKCRYGEEWKRSAGLIKLLMRKLTNKTLRMRNVTTILRKSPQTGQ